MNNTPLRISELPVGRTKAYQEINEGRLRAVKCGKLTLILPEDYDRWLKSLPPVVAKSSNADIPKPTRLTQTGHSAGRHSITSSARTSMEIQPERFRAVLRLTA